MRKTALILPLFLAAIYADNIDEMVQKIKADRESNISKQKLTNLASPIVEVKVKEVNKTAQNGEGNVSAVVEDEEIFVLKGIMNNMAFINDTWVKEGQKIGKYTLADIMDDAVYLKSKKKSKMVFMKSNNSKIKITGR